MPDARECKVSPSIIDDLKRLILRLFSAFSDYSPEQCKSNDLLKTLLLTILQPKGFDPRLLSQMGLMLPTRTYYKTKKTALKVLMLSHDPKTVEGEDAPSAAVGWSCHVAIVNATTVAFFHRRYHMPGFRVKKQAPNAKSERETSWAWEMAKMDQASTSTRCEFDGLLAAALIVAERA